MGGLGDEPNQGSEEQSDKALQTELKGLGWIDGGDLGNDVEVVLDQSGSLKLQTKPFVDQHPGISVQGLYDKAVLSMVHALDTMKGMADYHIVEEFYRLHHVSLALQHWGDDINGSEPDKSAKFNPLSQVENAGGVFQDMAVTLRRSLTRILGTQEELHDHLAGLTLGSVQLDNNSDPCSAIINTLDAQVNDLAVLVKPLRILSDRSRGIGLASKITAEIEKVEKELKQEREQLQELQRKKELSRPSERMSKCFQKSMFDGAPRKFLPAGLVEDFINHARRDELVMELEAEGSADKQIMVDYILDKAKLLFAIALAVGLEDTKLISAMETFRKKKIDDSCLPLFERQDQERRKSQGNEAIALEDIDTFWEVRANRFCGVQWQICVPRFSVGQVSTDLDQHTILPFIEMDVDSRSGGFGEVSKIRIHENHIDDPDGTFDELPQYYALKHIRPKEGIDVKRFWEKEASNLADMMKRKVKHAVRFITAFRRAIDMDATKWKHYLICEWADGGSLNDVWERTPRPLLNSDLVREVMVQLLGLADALVAAHYPSPDSSQRSFMRHGDLKPDNILCFTGHGIIGTLKIGDWGLAKQKNFGTMDQLVMSSVPHATARYLSPETFTGILINGNIHTDKRTRLQDTWAMGCMILEFIMWMLYGLDHVKAFHKSLQSAGHDKPFWNKDVSQLGANKAKVATQVIGEMDRIAKEFGHGKGASDNAIAALMDLVRKRLLVVDLPKGLGLLDIIEDEETENKSLGETLRRTLPRQGTVYEGIGGSPESLTVPEVVVVAPEEPTAPQLPANPNVPELPEGERKATRARAFELREILQKIVDDGDADDTGRYWFADNNKKDKRGKLPSEAPDTKTHFRTAPTITADSGYGSGFSGTTVISTSGSDRTTTTTTLTSSSGTEISQQRGSTESTERTGLRQQTGGLLSAPNNAKLFDYTFPVLDEAWLFDVDNRFAAGFFSAIRERNLSGYPDVIPASSGSGASTVLCQDCEGLRVWEVGFRVQYPVDKLRQKASTCELCKMFWEVCVKRKATGLSTASFVRDRSWLQLNGSGPPVLSLLRDPYLNGPKDLQMGLPVAIEVNTPAHFELMRRWLQTCENSHKHPPEMLSTLPTRLLDVGQDGDHSACLREIKDPDFEPGKYIALSHPWGNPPHFCTFHTTLARHKQGIEVESLPSSFRDAVITTRALGIRYLWIDSICIIQGPEGDFHEEARRMEQVFSAAVCVIAASSSTGQFDGWLDKGKDETTCPRAFVSLQYPPLSASSKQSSNSGDKGDHPRSVYISEIIDDFASDVLGSLLNRRGWVLQEHALARRTIFFTKDQTYFECGDGVRCMTLAKMTNSLAALLGDTAFPQIMMSATKGERILRYQDFYRNYSRLGLTRDYDRPIAIAGLQSRLIKAFNARGGFGIFDEGPQLRARGHLRRSLLWYRGDDVDTLRRIDFPTPTTDDENSSEEAPPPSWSWMAYTGGINYLELEFDGIDWEDEIGTPWWPLTAQPIGTRQVALEGFVRSFTFGIGGGREVELAVTSTSIKSEMVGGASASDETDRGRIIFDTPLETNDIPPGQIKCMILGRTSRPASDNEQRTVYVLVIAPLGGIEFKLALDGKLSSPLPQAVLWRRVGAGYLPESCIDESSLGRVCIV